MSTPTVLLARSPVSSSPAGGAAPNVPALPAVTHLEHLARLVLNTASGTMRTRRAARTLVGGTDSALRQTIVALMHMERLEDHACSNTATLQVLHGRVVLAIEDGRTLLQEGDWMIVPPTRHTLDAVGDAVVLITTVPPVHRKGRRTAFVD